ITNFLFIRNLNLFDYKKQSSNNNIRKTTILSPQKNKIPPYLQRTMSEG
ncbi:hypothetical protein HMPREF9075_01578, partial [Capnocytophaga sp. oral taxon 332 str. F0381]